MGFLIIVIIVNVIIGIIIIVNVANNSYELAGAVGEAKKELLQEIKENIREKYRDEDFGYKRHKSDRNIEDCYKIDTTYQEQTDFGDQVLEIVKDRWESDLVKRISDYIMHGKVVSKSIQGNEDFFKVDEFLKTYKNKLDIKHEEDSKAILIKQVKSLDEKYADYNKELENTIEKNNQDNSQHIGNLLSNHKEEVDNFKVSISELTERNYDLLMKFSNVMGRYSKDKIKKKKQQQTIITGDNT